MKFLGLKKHDLIIFGIVLIIAIGTLLFYKLGYQTDGNQVEVEINSKVVASYDLAIDRTVPLTGYTGGHCVMIIKDGSVIMSEAECPDQICVKHHSINKAGECIVCLPNRIVLNITVTEGQESDDDLDFVVH